MVNRVKTATVIGLNAYEVSVETDVTNSLPGMSVVGLPDTSVTEARDRVKEKVNNRLEGFLKQAKNYSPEDYKTASECEILICGDTVALFLSKNHAQMEDIFRKNCK